MSLKQINLLGFILILAFFASACSGGAGEQITDSLINDTPDQSIRDGETDGSGGIGGSGVMSVNIIGPVTAIDNTITDEAMGEITVGGIVWEYDAESVRWYDIPYPTDSTLKVGMVVEIWGYKKSEDEEGTTGYAETVDVIPAVCGPIETIADDTIMIMGQQVVVTDQTIFDPDNVSPPSMSGLAAGENIGVFGLLNSENNIEASLIQKYASLPYLESVSGIVVGINSNNRNRIQIGHLDIDLTDTGVPTGDVPTSINSIVVGDHVRAMGEMDEKESIFYAINIIKTAHVFEENEFLDISGDLFYITNPNFKMYSPEGIINFVIDDQTVFYDDLSPENLQVGIGIRIKGTFKNGVVWAEEIYLNF